MAGWDGDALAGSMEEALERQQPAQEKFLLDHPFHRTLPHNLPSAFK